MESATFDHVTISIEDVNDPTNVQIAYQFLGATMTVAPGSPVTNIGIATPWGIYWVDISAFAGKTIRIKIHVDSDTSINFAGLAFDDVKIYSIPLCSPSSITLGTSPAVCSGVTSVNLPYTATTGTPDQYSIDYDAAAEAAGFADVANAAYRQHL